MEAWCVAHGLLGAKRTKGSIVTFFILPVILVAKMSQNTNAVPALSPFFMHEWFGIASARASHGKEWATRSALSNQQLSSKAYFARGYAVRSMKSPV